MTVAELDHETKAVSPREMNVGVQAYNDQQVGEFEQVCKLLAKHIDSGFTREMSSKVWHGAPVWFDQGNPLVGYWVRKDHVQLLFWSGQTFDEVDLQSQGKFKAAERRYVNSGEIVIDDLRRWLAKSESIQWDYKNIVKRRGELLMLGAEDKLDLRKTSSRPGALSRDSEVILFEGNVPVGTLPRRKAVVDSGSVPGGTGILRKSSKARKS